MNFKRNDKDKYDRTYDYSTKQDYVSRLLKDRETAEVKFKPAKGGFFINDWSEGRYLMLMSKSARPSQFDDLTGIEKPSWHLETDGFWHLQYPGETLGKSATPSKAWLKDNVEYARFDEDLWFLLQNKEWFQKLLDYIIERKLTDDTWLGKMAAE